jgi:flavin reductase
MAENKPQKPESVATIDAKDFREAMSHIPMAVHIVTTNGPFGLAGLTATAVTSVSDSPATMLVCINLKSRTFEHIEKNGVFCINTLGAEHQDLADIFAGRTDLTGRERFKPELWSTLKTGAPYLTSARIAFDCEIENVKSVGTHAIVVGSVKDITLAQTHQPLGYTSRRYFHLTAES